MGDPTAIDILIKPNQTMGSRSHWQGRAARGRVRRDEPGPSGTGRAGTHGVPTDQRADSRRIPTTKDVLRLRLPNWRELGVRGNGIVIVMQHAAAAAN